MPTTKVLDVEIFHEEAGHGRPLVLLHGLNDSHRSWRSIVPKLAKSRRVLVPDLPGCGLSGRPDATYSLEWQATVMATWLDQLGLDDVDVVGHSYGGGVAQYMLLLRPQRIRRLALVSSGGLGREVSLELRLASFSKIVEAFGQRFMAPIAANALRAVGGVITADEATWMSEVNAVPGTARAFARTVADVIDWRGQTRNFLDHASEIEKFPPVALFWGTSDRVIPHSHAIATQKMLRGAQLKLFEGCGHFPHQQKPDEFAEALLRFMNARYVLPVRFEQPEAPEVPAVESGLLAVLRRWVPAREPEVRAATSAA